MTIEDFLVIVGIVFLAFAQLGMWLSKRNVYVKSKYDRGRYIQYKG